MQYVGGFWKLCFDPQKEQQIKIEGEFKPTVDCLCATRRGLVAVYTILVVVAFSQPQLTTKNEIGNPFWGSLSHFFVGAILQQHL